MAAFVLQKVGDRGASDPIVARTTLQTAELASPFVNESAKKDLIGIAMDVQRRLAACDTINSQLQKEVQESLDQLSADGLQFQAQGRAVEIPAIMELQDRAERFLYNAKLCLRDTAKLFKPFFGQHFNENYKEFTEWATKAWGESDPLTKLLVADRPWIAQVIEMRNGVEHPTHKSGPLKITNFSLDQTVMPLRLSVPTWSQGERTPSAIDADMGTITANLLTFYEELLVLSLLKVNKMPFLSIGEIPLANRSPEAPIRFRHVLTKSFPAT